MSSDLTDIEIGPYKVIRQIGEGGMGAVYEALHRQLGRKVAIKVLHAEFAANSEVAARFFNEARAVNLIEHPALIQIQDYGQLSNGSPYLVMEFLRGQTLSERLRLLGGTMPESKALQLTWQLASALSAAHSKAIVHRDLKPSNVMLVPDPTRPDGEQVKLLDFGIAKINDSTAAAVSEVRTKTGIVMGTPLYMSPEQCRGAGAVDGKSDAYSLGVMLFQMLVGRPPFMDAGDGGVLGMHMFIPAPEVRQLAPQVTPEAADLVRRMLSKNREERPNMYEVLLALDKMGIGVLAQEAPDARTRPASHATAVRNSGSIPNPSTLTRGSGQRAPLKTAKPAVLAILTCLGLAAVAGGLFLRHQAVAPASQTSTPPHKRIRWSIQSHPSAVILRQADKHPLGDTPWQDERDAATGQLSVVLRREGYQEHPVSLDLSHDEAKDVTLIPQVAPGTGSGSPVIKRTLPTGKRSLEKAKTPVRTNEKDSRYID